MHTVKAHVYQEGYGNPYISEYLRQNYIYLYSKKGRQYAACFKNVMNEF